MDVRAILLQKSRPVHTVTIDQSVDEAIQLMVSQKAGALIVADMEQPVGIFTERDVLRCYLLNRERGFSDIKLKSAITGRFIAATPTEAIPDLITLMIKSDLEHLPVMEDNRILGLLAFKDLVEFQLESLMEEIHHLNDYIDDLHEAGQD